MVYRQDTSGIRDAKEAVDDAKREIEIANIKKEIDLLEDQKSLLNEQIDLLDEQADKINKFYDTQIKALEKQKEQTESYFESIIKSLENSKSKYEELTEIVDKAELSGKLKQLGIDEEALLNGSEEEFEKLKNAYMDVVFKLNEGNDEVLTSLQELSGYNGTAPTMLSDSNTELDTMNGKLDESNQSVSNVNSSLTDTASTTGDVAANVSEISTNLTEANGLLSEEQTAFNNLKSKIDEVIEAINLKTQAIQEEQNATSVATSSEMADFLLLKEKILEVKETLESFGTPEEGLINDIALAIQSLNDITLDEGLITQFTNLKEAIDSVTSAINGGGESSGGEGQGKSGSTQGGKSGGNNSEGSSGGNSLTGAITEMGTTASKVIGQPDAEGDSTVIGEFGSMETAVNDVTSAIGGGDSESGEGSGGGKSGGENDGNLIDSIIDLGETTEEILGKPGGEGVTGKFEQFKVPIQEADEHVHSISDGLNEIDGKEVECTIKVNIETSGGTSFTGSAQVLGSMNLDSAEYNAQYGNAHAEGTALVSGNWAVQSDEQNALVGEVGRELIVRGGRFFTVGDNGAEMFNIKKGDIVFNHEQTEALLKNGHISGRGKAYADGTVNGGKILTPDGKILRPLQPGDRGYDLMKAFEPLVQKMLNGEEDIVSNAVFEGQRQMEQWTKEITNNTVINNIANNRNVQQPIVNNISVTCPGVTEQQVAERIGNVLGKELDKQFNGFHNYVDQQSRIRR